MWQVSLNDSGYSSNLRVAQVIITQIKSTRPSKLIICEQGALPRLVHNFVAHELIAVDHHAVHAGSDANRNRAIVGGHGVVKPVVLTYTS